MAALPYLILLCIFGAIFLLITEYSDYKQEQKIVKKRFSGLEREEKKGFWLKSLFKPLAAVNTRLGSKQLRDKVERNLLSAGSPLTVDEYFVFRELMILFLAVMAGIFIGWDKLTANPIWFFVIAVVGFVWPSLWLKTRVENRKRAVLCAIPNIIDLLILAVDAGLDFMVAVRRVIERSRPGPMVDELSQMFHEVQMGCIRRDALKNMSRRLNIPEVNSFARTLIQAERMGTPMGEALRNLSDEIRIRQFQRGEQQALKAPIKMLFPLLFCILPVVLVLVGGPVILEFFQSGISFK
ncbi:MAG: type II secretion system F family protein [Candidatus Omnitrophica bacterium]|nr:type II secretion system F family protein [Candidatus Omnitrophota bacterium]